MVKKQPYRLGKSLPAEHQGRWLCQTAKQTLLLCCVAVSLVGCGHTTAPASQMFSKAGDSITQTSMNLFGQGRDWLVQQGVLEKQVKPKIRYQRVRQAQLRADYRTLLERDDAMVYRLGDHVHMVLPNKKLFVFGSANLTREGETLLGLSCRYMRTYLNIGQVDVEAFVSSRPLLGKPRYYKWALTRQRSKLVANRFARCGLSSNFITAKAGGDTRAVAWNGTAEGRYFNRRVEIVFDVYRT